MTKKWLLISPVIFLFIVGSYFLFIQPATLPAPTGPYAVGRSDFFWTDLNRREPHEQAQHEHRIVPVSLYYPAMPPKDQQRIPYSPLVIEKITTYINTQFHIPKILLKPLQDLKTHSYKEAPQALHKQKLPLIIFSHGLTGSPNSYSNLIEHLASHGYIVAAITHAYASEDITLSDGAILKHSINLEGQRYPLKKAIREFEQELWTGDVRFLLDELEKMQLEATTTILAAIDLNKIGIIGHSFGGSTATQSCRLDRRFKAGINMDGGLNGPNFLAPFNTPFMLLLAEKASEKSTPEALAKRGYNSLDELKDSQLHYETGMKLLFDALIGDKFCITLQGAQHNTFSDDPVISKSSLLLKLCTLRETTPFSLLTNNYTLQFFDQYLKGKRSALLAGIEGQQLTIPK